MAPAPLANPAPVLAVGEEVDLPDVDVVLVPVLGRPVVVPAVVEGAMAVLVVGKPARAQYWAIMPA